MNDELLKNYDLVETEDGSKTLFSKNYNEACHSTSGASAETVLHYINGCQVEKKIKEAGTINILEVGFGTGLGFLETLKALRGLGQFNFYSFEIDENLVIYFFKHNNFDFKKENSKFTAIGKDFKLSILVGNARDQVKNIDKKFHAIYQDAFSPKRNSILWTTEWFESLKKISDTSCIMSTYSSSSSIRKSMLAAGWRVLKGEQFGPKRSSTRAKLTGESDSEIIAHLERSPALTITDANFNEYKL